MKIVLVAAFGALLVQQTSAQTVEDCMAKEWPCCKGESSGNLYTFCCKFIVKNSWINRGNSLRLEQLVVTQEIYDTVNESEWGDLKVLVDEDGNPFYPPLSVVLDGLCAIAEYSRDRYTDIDVSAVCKKQLAGISCKNPKLRVTGYQYPFIYVNFCDIDTFVRMPEAIVDRIVETKVVERVRAAEAKAEANQNSGTTSGGNDSYTNIQVDTTTRYICEGDSVLFAGNYVKNEGTHLSIRGNEAKVLNLNLYPTYNIRDSIELCIGEIRVIGKDTLSEVGDSLVLTKETAFGCDSIITMIIDTIVACPNPDVCYGRYEDWKKAEGVFAEGSILKDGRERYAGQTSIAPDKLRYRVDLGHVWHLDHEKGLIDADCIEESIKVSVSAETEPQTFIETEGPCFDCFTEGNEPERNSYKLSLNGEYRLHFLQLWSNKDQSKFRRWDVSPGVGFRLNYNQSVIENNQLGELISSIDLQLLGSLRVSKFFKVFKEDHVELFVQPEYNFINNQAKTLGWRAGVGYRF